MAESLRDVCENTESLITDVYVARNILFPREYRREFADAYLEFDEQFRELINNLGAILSDYEEHLYRAGLQGAQLQFKIKSFEKPYLSYKRKDGFKRLLEALKKSKAILGSLGGAVPGIGSFLQ